MRSRCIRTGALVSFVVAFALSGAVVEAGGAKVQEASELWVVNGGVHALAVSGRTLYVGGGFTQVSPRTGPLIAVSAATGALVPVFPRVEGGSVRAVVGDGQGGWFVGGDFDKIGGVACPDLAHVTVAMSVDRGFCPKPDGDVDSLLEDGTTLYVGGDFARIGGTRRASLAAVDAATGRVASWTPPALDGGVFDMAFRNGVLYLLGGFGTVGGKSRFSLAAVDVGTRQVTGWDPKAPAADQHGDISVQSIAATPSAVYVGGVFEQIGGGKRPGLAALDPVSGKATAWVPSGQPQSVNALLVAGGRLYAGGSTRSGGYLIAYDSASGAPAAWSPAVKGVVTALAVDGSRVYVGGDRSQAFDLVTGASVPWSAPAPNEPPITVAIGGGVVLFGGEFTGAGGVYRDGLAAVDLSTGRATSWSPTVSSREGQPEIDTITLSGGNVYFGGVFDRVGGKHRPLLASVDATTGTVTAWAPRLRPKVLEQVLTIAVSGASVYVGGYGIAAAFDRQGRLTAWRPKPTGQFADVQAIAPVNRDVYVGGDYDSIGGASRTALAAVDARSGTATAWNAQLGGLPKVESLAKVGSILFVGGSFDDAGNLARDSLASLNLTTHKWTNWAPRLTRPPNVPGISNIAAIAATRHTVYAGGVGGLAAFDRLTGKSRNWNPATSGSQAIPTVDAIAVVGTTVYVGDDGGLDTFPTLR